MTYSNKYISDSNGRCFKISAMTEKKVGLFIKGEYQKLKHIKERLNSLHDHLLALRLEHSPNAVKPDIGKKIIKHLKLGLKTDQALLMENQRLMEVFNLALKVLEQEADLDVVKSVLKQGVQND
tara:strand:+ start:1459 stop:1830 length:372 start_codon:yes stop_codon:yes gene_type:complete